MDDLEEKVLDVEEDQITNSYWQDVRSGVRDYSLALFLGGVAATYGGELPAEHNLGGVGASAGAAYVSGSVVGYTVYFVQQALLNRQSIGEFFDNAAAFLVSDSISDQLTFTPVFGASAFLLEQHSEMTSVLRNTLSWGAASGAYILGMSHLQPKINSGINKIKTMINKYQSST